ncbi:conserved hypothetical protein [Histoplasma capsulatum H143]|uniref:HNH nuclease domain-containing protein n=1 Tax=Ajellomyces capsulatus (strain H143) TaxID=544712 RepID=C6H2U4_AJECH|nr:conserved hypothetical protein [Histoplasma capsulatum H143]
MASAKLIADAQPDDLVADYFSSPSPFTTPSPPTFNVDAARTKIRLYNPRTEDDKTKAILTSFLDYLPKESKYSLAEFIAYSSEETLYKLSKHLYTALLLPIKAESATPRVTPSPLNDADDDIEEMASVMDKPPTRNRQKLMKKLFLKRDDFRCLATGAIDLNYHGTRESLTGNSGITELAHIIPFSMGAWSDKQEEHEVAQTWATLKRLFPIAIGPSGINDPTNLLTLWSPIHDEFGALRLAFNPTGRENEYEILTFGRFQTMLGIHLPQSRMVTFRSHSDMALPSPELLGTHAALAKILHASGMAETIDNIMRDWNELRCLANDGGTNFGDILFARLQTCSV